ncbi:MAG: zinc ribbon domain-containing protein [Spirochaetota bacterium]
MHCQSCGMPMSDETRNSATEEFCRYCADEKGALHPRRQVQSGIADWLKSFSPAASDDAIAERADHYLRSMPAWAER